MLPWAGYLTTLYLLSSPGRLEQDLTQCYLED